MTISAEVVLDSISPAGHRLTTFKLVYPKFIHGEFMTHRVISRNASSSRAIPTAKLLAEVRSDVLRAAPVFWGKNQAGMQAAEELTGDTLESAKARWAIAAADAAHQAEQLLALGAHKQIVNRLLEPFSHIRVVASATEWDNFFGLRLHKDAQPEMRALAVAMWEVRQASVPRLLQPGEWHLPFVGIADQVPLMMAEDQIGHRFFELAKRVSVARCARVSYESFETGKRSSVEEDLRLYDRLVGAQPLHASPAEHQATPDYTYDAGGWVHRQEHGNFKGWRMLRKQLPGEAMAPIPAEFNQGA